MLTEPGHEERTLDRPLRVAFFALLPTGNVATRTFCERPAARLGGLGIEGRLCAPSSQQLYDRLHRGRGGWWRVSAAFYWYCVALPVRLYQIFSTRRYDAVLVQRGLLRYSSPPVLEAVVGRLLRRPVVLHLDDGLWAVARPSYYRRKCRLANVVITGNAHVADFARKAGAHVERVEYAVEVARYPLKQHRKVTPVIIGYTARDAEDFLPLVAEPLRRVCEATGARVKVVSARRRPRIPELDPFLDWERWTLEREYLHLADYDVGIMPLSDNEHNRGKEPYKVKEYLAAGLPIVLAPVGHNLSVVREGVDGLFASTSAEWVSALTRLVTDEALRARLGANGRALASERYDYPTLLRRLSEILHQVAAQGAPMRAGEMPEASRQR